MVDTPQAATTGCLQCTWGRGQIDGRSTMYIFAGYEPALIANTSLVKLQG